jgi:hypothetical protein
MVQRSKPGAVQADTQYVIKGPEAGMQVQMVQYGLLGLGDQELPSLPVLDDAIPEPPTRLDGPPDKGCGISRRCPRRACPHKGDRMDGLGNKFIL